MMTSKQLLIKPLTLSDSQILDLVCKFNQVHETGSEESSSFNVQALFSVVSTIMNRSLIGDVDTGHGTTIEEDHHKAMPDNFEPPTRMLKHISCQMIHTAHDENHSYAHETTMSILEQLKPYSWESKAVIVLAAFSLEYGTFFHLSQVSGEDNLGRSLALLYHVHVFQKNLRSATGSDYNHIVENAFETVKRIIELQSLLNEGHEEESVPSLTEAKHEFPVFVYWVVLTIVACALHFKFLLGHRPRIWEPGKFERII
ncbi:protein SIEVE ELEMENT OCCLUSION B-like isoform X2 [Prosopis cineraria]|uniref:protein SIEVE ELEMENT OCCLUSION B-like isoform X2 n=1 Tax=Prosopis cineraria TaxID=364024 RepID=UPI00240FAEE5|nr:protein SIEVE ELEMENT OCCLUSION B-like isoform X2 [Prosopis cineraria]